MSGYNFSITKALVRGMTDGIEFGRRSHTQSQSIPELIECVKNISDHASTLMRSALAAAYPDIGWSGSEDKHLVRDSSAPYWVYDPIDGAYHYLQGLPPWSSTLALVVDGQAVMAQVYDPSTRELFYAESGKGSWRNGHAIHVSAKTDLRSAVVGTALPPIGGVGPSDHEHALQLMNQVSREVFVVRQMAAASLQLAYVAAGRLDAYVESGTDVYDWLAAALIVKEAGGTVSALDGTDFGLLSKGVLASTSKLHEALLAHCPS